MTIKLTTLEMLGPQDIKNYNTIVIRDLPENQFNRISFKGFEGEINTLERTKEKYAICGKR